MRGGSRDRAVEVPRGGASSAVTYGIRACPRPCSSVRIERLPSKQRVAGSSPAGGATTKVEATGPPRSSPLFARRYACMLWGSGRQNRAIELHVSLAVLEQAERMSSGIERHL